VSKVTLDDIETGEVMLLRDKPGGNLFTGQVVSGIEAASVGSGFHIELREPVIAMLREKQKQRSCNCESIEARHRDGAARSSDETSVMEVERRGCVILPYSLVNPATGRNW